MTWFGRPKAPEPATPLPPTDDPAPPPIPLPKLSEARQCAIDEAIAAGKARNVRHALFLANAGALSLPD